ncbi:MAG: hypothetical protein ABR987_21510 [Terracidiphilus sp.]|jgi:hypothetical protein
MLAKKLVTLGCAVGILACGACFLPPLHEPPPPPVRLDFEGIQRIRVEVSNNSESHHLDPNALASFIEVRINSQARLAGVKAFSQKDPASADADGVLHVTVLSETVAPARPESTGGGEPWDVQVSLSAVLTKKDAQVVWRESDGDYRFLRSLSRANAAAIWKGPAVRNLLGSETAWRLVNRMLNAQ